MTRQARKCQCGAWNCLLALATALLVVGGPTRVAGAEHKENSKDDASTLEYQLKAGFLFNFAKFVQWPSTNAAATNDFRIGILDDGSVYPVISAALANKAVNARTVSVERLTRLRDVQHLDLLFVTRSQEGKIPALLRQVGKAPVLTVGETQDFAADGGCLNFIRQGQHVRFEVNLQAAERSGLKVSSKLASMAKVVHPAKDDK